MNHSYTIRQFIISRYIGFAVTGILFWIALWTYIAIKAGDDVSKMQEIISIILFVGGFLAIILLSLRYSQVACKITLSDNGIERNWIERPFLFFRKDHTYPWSLISSYKIDEDANGELVKINFHNKKSLTIAHSTSSEDDFSLFLQELEEHIEQYNATPDGTNAAAAHIVKAPSFYETNWAKALAVFIGIMLVALTIAQYATDVGIGDLQWWKTIWLYFMGIPFIIRVFSGNPAKY